VSFEAWNFFLKHYIKVQKTNKQKTIKLEKVSISNKDTCVHIVAEPCTAQLTY